MSERKQRLTYRDHPVVYLCVCGVLAVGAMTLLLVTGVKWFKHGEGSWMLGAGVLVLVGFATTAVVLGVREAARTLRDEPRKSEKRADLCRHCRIWLFLLAAFSLISGGMDLVVAVRIWRAAPKLSDYVGGSAEMKSAMESIHAEALGDVASSATVGVLWLLASAVAIWGARGVRRRIRRAEGRCVQCGYLLTGLPEARCPECGTAFNPADLEEDRGRQESGAADRRQG